MIAVVIIVLGIIEFVLHPRFDVTREGDWILWYGNKKRKYFKL